MKDLYDMLKQIEEKYYMYLGGYSIYQLKAFIDGYMFARIESGLPEGEQEKDFGDFHEWLENRLDARTTLSWAKILEFRSFNEREASTLFFKLLDEFINRDKDNGRLAKK